MKERNVGQRWYFRKLMATGSLFLCIYSSGGIDSAMELIPCQNQFLVYENSDTLRKIEREGTFTR